MTLRWLLAAIHLLALGIGLGAVWVRGSVLQGQLDKERLNSLFLADTYWGVAAVLWIVTGLLRAFAGFEKGTEYYLNNGAFLIKMALLLLILALEVWPMITLIQWRMCARRGDPIDNTRAPAMARISRIQAVLVILMVLAATAMARGLGGQI
jgi:putative membrane protein